MSQIACILARVYSVPSRPAHRRSTADLVYVVADESLQISSTLPSGLFICERLHSLARLDLRKKLSCIRISLLPTAERILVMLWLQRRHHIGIND